MLTPSSTILRTALSPYSEVFPGATPTIPTPSKVLGEVPGWL